MHAWHDSQLASQYETYDADQLQGYSITPGLHSECAEDLTQVASNDEAITSTDHYRTHANTSTLEPSEVGVNPVPSPQVLGLAVSHTETYRDVSQLDPDELRALLPEQACHCATCLVGYDNWKTRSELWRNGSPVLTGRTLSCRVTGCQWTTESHTSPHHNDVPELLIHEGFSGREEHYGEPGEYKCREAGCKRVTKRWEDFLRHSTSKHCIKPKDLKCPFLECKYHHIDFSRKDKLKSHVDKVHKGTHHSREANQAIKPKVKDHAYGAAENSTS